MRMLALAGLALPFLLTCSAPALSAGGTTGGGGAGITLPSIPARGLQRHNAIVAVRAEGLRLQAADGGTLTDAHRAYLQAKLNAVLAGNY
jgi:hypothetical protein